MSIGIIIYGCMKIYCDTFEPNILNATMGIIYPHEAHNGEIEKLPKITLKYEGWVVSKVTH